MSSYLDEKDVVILGLITHWIISVMERDFDK